MTERTARRPAIEGLRLLGVFGVVWFAMHAPGFRIGYAALGLFAVLGGFFAVRSARAEGAARFLRGRWRRIGVPWLGWSAVYLVVSAVLLRDPLAAIRLGDPLALLVGPSLHLWFLPFLLLVCGAVVLVEPVTRGAGGIARLLLVGIPLSVGCFWIQTFVLPPAPLAQWCYGVPCVIHGIISAQAKAGGAGPGWRAAPLVFIAAVAAISYALGATEDVAPAVLAALVFEAVWRRGARGGAWMRVAGGLALGTYLAHPVFLLVYFKLFPGGGAQPVAGAVFVFALSVAAAAILTRLPVARRFV